MSIKEQLPGNKGKTGSSSGGSTKRSNRKKQGTSNEKYNTGMAAEFYVLSILHRLGIAAHLTLGNNKAVDILVKKGDKYLSIDVKGLAKEDNFPMNNFVSKNNHYYVFVCFLSQINNPCSLPEIYIVPSTDLIDKQPDLKNKTLLYKAPNSKGKTVQYGRLKKFTKYKDNWKVFCE